MKRTISMLLAFVICLSMLPAVCHADYTVAQLSSTRAFLKALDEHGIQYTWMGIDNDGDEKIRIKDNDDNWGSYTITIFFTQDQEDAYIYVWNLMSYNDYMLSSVVQAVNRLNADYHFVKFYADTSDNTITAQYDAIFRSNDVGDIMLEALVSVVNVVSKSYEYLSPFIA